MARGREALAPLVKGRDVQDLLGRVDRRRTQSRERAVSS